MRIRVSLIPVLPLETPAILHQAKCPLTTKSSLMSLSEYFTPPIAATLIDADTPSRTLLNMAAEGYLLFEVEDKGIGIAEDKLKTLFMPFKQAQRFAGGTGLGLFSLAKRVEAQRGQYGARNRNDGTVGCVFWFALPYVPDPTMKSDWLLTSCRESDYTDATQIEDYFEKSSTVPDISVLPTSATPSSPLLDVLLVDDSVSVLKSTRMMLTRQGHNVDTAVNGVDGLEYLLKKHYDIVLMDIQVRVIHWHMYFSA